MMKLTVYKKDDCKAVIELTTIEAAEMMKVLTEIKPTNIKPLTEALNNIITVNKK